MAMPAATLLNSQATGVLSRLKPNERRLLIGLGLLALAAAPIQASDQADKAQADHASAQVLLERARTAALRGQGGVAGDLAAAQAEVRNWSWRAESLEVGRVQIQNQVAELAEGAGLAEVEVKLGDKTEAAGPVSLVPVDLSANFSWSGLSRFLAALDDTGKGVVLDSVTLPDDDKPRLKLSLRAPLVVTPPRAAGAPR